MFNFNVYINRWAYSLFSVLVLFIIFFGSELQEADQVDICWRLIKQYEFIHLFFVDICTVLQNELLKKSSTPLSRTSFPFSNKNIWFVSSKKINFLFDSARSKVCRILNAWVTAENEYWTHIRSWAPLHHWRFRLNQKTKMIFAQSEEVLKVELISDSAVFSQTK